MTIAVDMGRKATKTNKQTVHITTIFSWAGRVKNDRRNSFMINLHESMGPGMLPDTLQTALRGPVRSFLIDGRTGESSYLSCNSSTPLEVS